MRYLSTNTFVMLITLAGAAVGCDRPEEPLQTASQAQRASDETCEDLCTDFNTCKDINDCQKPCNYWQEVTPTSQDEQSYRYCRQSTCTAQSNLPCENVNPPPGGGGGPSGPSGGPRTCADPRPNQVVMYEHGDFKGECWTVTVSGSSYDEPWIVNSGIWNDAVSSMKVGDALSVTMFHNAHFSGHYSVWHGWWSYLGGAVNDKTSSFAIRKIR